MTLHPSQPESRQKHSAGEKHNYWKSVSHRLFFIFVSFALLAVICLTDSAVYAKPPLPTISLPEKSQGDHASANNTQDDNQIIQSNGALLMADDHGNDQANATVLGNTTDGTTVTLNGTGLIERRTDIDFFHFVSGNGNGSVSLTINNVTDKGVVSVSLPPNTHGSVLIRVLDTARSHGNRFVDELYISTENYPGVPPSAPIGLNAVAVSSGQINLTWTDNTINEYGFRIERSIDYGLLWNTVAMVGEDIQTYSDTDVVFDATYRYRISAYNGSGQSGYDGPVNATTYPVSIVLSVNGYKEKGSRKVDLVWSNATTEYVDIYRNDTLIGTAHNSFPYTYIDNIGKGGGDSYTYHVCESSSIANCSETITVNF